MWTSEQTKRMNEHLDGVQVQMDAASPGSMAGAMASFLGAMSTQCLMSQIEFENRQIEVATKKDRAIEETNNDG